MAEPRCQGQTLNLTLNLKPLNPSCQAYCWTLLGPTWVASCQLLLLLLLLLLVRKLRAKRLHQQARLQSYHRQAWQQLQTRSGCCCPTAAAAAACLWFCWPACWLQLRHLPVAAAAPAAAAELRYHYSLLLILH